MVYIPYIHFEFFTQLTMVSAIYLRPASNARPYLVPTCLFFVEQLKINGGEWPGADEGHVAYEDIPELGELVDGGAAHELADLGEALRVGQEVAVGIALVGHRLELDHLEDLPSPARTLLVEEGSGSLIRYVEPQRYYCQWNGKDNQCDQCNAKVAQALKEMFVHRS